MKKQKFNGEIWKVGDEVRLKDKRFKSTAKIEMFYSDVKNGVRLDSELDGFYSWNLADLEKVEKQ